MSRINRLKAKHPGIPVSCIILLLLLQVPAYSQKVPDEEIKKRIQAYKTDIRGPYKDIRWFCPDGTTRPPQERCPEPGGVQRARYKNEVNALSKSNHLFLGQILSTTPFPDFWDESNYQSRLKQYEIQKYLQSVDQGWILRKAQYYRGAYQAEDESRWGLEFCNWLLAGDRVLEENYFLIRQSMKSIPHMGDDNLTQEIRSLSKVVSDTFPPFLDLRVKIHGQPDSGDLEKVIEFRNQHSKELSEDLLKQLDQLIEDMKILYKPVDLKALNKYLDQLPSGSDLRNVILAELAGYGASTDVREKIKTLSEILFGIRRGILSLDQAGQRRAVLDFSIAVENLLMRELSGIIPNSLRVDLETIHCLGLACAGSGYIEMWEWEALSPRLNPPSGNDIPLERLVDFFEAGRSLTEWGTGMFRALYSEDLDRFDGFEPLVSGFTDDRIRSSLLLYLGQSVDLMGTHLIKFKPDSNQVMNLRGQQSIRGLNPGLATGELVVVTGSATNLDVENDKIYVFEKPPSDLKPVAGIATVSEGNMVSHVQLLARNLGIPNAVLNQQNLEDLKAYSGQRVFYAVSPGGTVILKPVDQIDTEEKNLIDVKKRSQEKISVPVEKINLAQVNVIPLTRVSAQSSGVLCGPKAANLGQLKSMFPDHVVNGIVVPFGIFRKHLDQDMPGQDISYWEHLSGIFDGADQMRSNEASDSEVEAYMLKELESFRKSIQDIPLLDDFLTDLKRSFVVNFDKEMGRQPVFLRSDTNMEDLKDFTGAGLNLTVFNVLEYESILQGIRNVWASPYTERSYRWRQQYLLNPENVFPSILIIPTVDVDCSGVMVTKGVSNQEKNDLTIAFNHGAGGAVDGQAAESYLLRQDGTNLLLAPAREPSYIRLPATGGSRKYYATFDQPVLVTEQIDDLRVLADQIREKLPDAPGIESLGPFDMELGFKEGKLWLFQVRPFVENRNTATSEYLNSLNPNYNRRKMVPVNDQEKAF